jgi:hypothetical protein
MKSKLTPTPTEYRGIRFRSKCEAMFALNLDVCRSSFRRKEHFEMQWWEAIWTYEPKFEWLNGFSCDFLLTWIGLENEKLWTDHRLVEYKPSKPTKTFCINYFRKFFKYRDSTEKQPNTQREALIFYGSAYNEDRGVVRWRTEDEELEFFEFDWIHDDTKLLHHRFDLEGGSV